MSKTILKTLVNTFGGDISPVDEPRIAKDGLTAGKMIFSGVETTFDVPATLISGFTPAANQCTRQLSLSSLAVPERASAPARVSIVPKLPLTGSPTFSAASVVLKVNDDIEDNKYESLMYDNGSGNDQSFFTFSGVTLGKRDLELGNTTVTLGTLDGEESVTATGGSVPLVQTFESVDDRRTEITEYLHGRLGTDSTAVESGTLGSFPVLITIQTLLNDYESFIIPAGVQPPAAGVLKKNDGVTAFDFEDEDLVDEDGLLQSDFEVKPSELMITEQFSLTHVKFLARHKIPEGTQVSFGDFEAGTVSLQDSGDRYPQVSYEYNGFPRYTFDLSQGSVLENGFLVGMGSSLPAGTVVPVGSATTDLSEEESRDLRENLEIENISIEKGYILPANDVSLEEVILRSDRVVTKKGFTISQFQPMVVGASTTEPLTLDQVLFPSGAILDSDLTFNSDNEFDGAAVAAVDSVIAAGSVINQGASSIPGAKIKGEIVIPTGSVCTDNVSVTSPFLIEAGSVELKTGTVMRGPFEFQVGTKFYEGNCLPSPLKIVFQMAVVLAAGMSLIKDTFLGSLAVLYGNLGFSKNGVIPALSTLSGMFNLPIGTILEKGFTCSIPIPVPDKTKFKAGGKLHAGMSFRQGTAIPPIENLRSQCGEEGSVLRLVNSTSDGEYYVIKAGTALIAGFQIPVGSVLATESGDWEAMTAESENTVTIQSGGYSLDNTVVAAAVTDFTLTVGVKTGSLIKLLGDLHFDYDLAIPVESAQPDLTTYLGFNERFVLQEDIILKSEFTVYGSNNVMWPVNFPIPVEFVLTAPFQLNFTSPYQIPKKIQFNISTTDEFTYGIMDSAASMKMPPAGYKLEHDIELAVDQPVSAGSTHALKATVILATGTKIKMSGGSNQYITLSLPMKVESDFTLTAPFLTTSRVYLKNGIKFIKEQELPGQIHVTENQTLPANITLPQAVTLAADVVIKDDPYNISQYTILKAGSKLAAGSVFNDETMISSGVTMSPILVTTSSGIFYFFEDSELSTDIHYFSLYNSSIGAVKTILVDASRLLKKILELSERLDSLEVSKI